MSKDATELGGQILDSEEWSVDAIAAEQARLTAQYDAKGMFTKVFDSAAGERSPAHAHEGAEIFTIAGDALVRLDDGEWGTVKPGSLLVIADNQKHEVINGQNGWKYLFACSLREARRQGLLV
jgi:quercetin dioxygenase-like cupin family protein